MENISITSGTGPENFGWSFVEPPTEDQLIDLANSVASMGTQDDISRFIDLVRSLNAAGKISDEVAQKAIQTASSTTDLIKSLPKAVADSISSWDPIAKEIFGPAIAKAYQEWGSKPDSSGTILRSATLVDPDSVLTTLRKYGIDVDLSPWKRFYSDENKIRELYAKSLAFLIGMKHPATVDTDVVRAIAEDLASNPARYGDVISEFEG